MAGLVLFTHQPIVVHIAFVARDDNLADDEGGAMFEEEGHFGHPTIHRRSLCTDPVEITFRDTADFVEDRTLRRTRAVSIDRRSAGSRLFPGSSIGSIITQQVMPLCLGASSGSGQYMGCRPISRYERRSPSWRSKLPRY